MARLSTWSPDKGTRQKSLLVIINSAVVTTLSLVLMRMTALPLQGLFVARARTCSPVFSVVHPNWTKTGACPYQEIFEYEWPPYLLIWAATKETLGHSKI
jgi:hypothetical protein